MFETQKVGDKTSSGLNGPDIRTKPKIFIFNSNEKRDRKISGNVCALGVEEYGEKCFQKCTFSECDVKQLNTM